MRIICAAAVLFVSAPAFGQNPPPAGRGRGQGGPPDSMRPAMQARAAEAMDGLRRGGPPDDFGRFLFPPDMVMQRQREIGLTEAQKTLIIGATQKLESDVVSLNWKLTDEHQKLNDLVRATPIDSAATLAQIDKVLDLERQIKRVHIATLVRIKNALTSDQQRTLRELQPQWMPRLDGAPLPGGGGGRGRGRGQGDGRGHGVPIDSL